MKPVRVLLSLIIVVAVLFASVLPTSAIGFDAEVAYESVFVIYSGNYLGSGFAIGKNYVVTNAHVIGDKRDITVTTYGGAEYSASLVGMDEYKDIAVLYVKNVEFQSLTVANLSEMKIGDDIYAIGAPKGMTYTLTKGGVSAKDRMIENQSYIQIDAAINKGNSGGPLLNDAGEVLGMNTLKMTDSEGIGLAIPITRICSYLISLGIDVNTNGNIVDSTNPTEPSTQPPTTENRNEENNPAPNGNEQPSKTNSIATIIAVLSLITNVVLVSLLIYQKKKKNTPTVQNFDPSERTDFEIDILE